MLIVIILDAQFYRSWTPNLRNKDETSVLTLQRRIFSRAVSFLSWFISFRFFPPAVWAYRPLRRLPKLPPSVISCIFPTCDCEEVYSPTFFRRSVILRSGGMRSPLDLVTLYFFHNAWYSFERRNKKTSLSCSFSCTNNTIVYKNRLIHTYVINTTILSLCYPDMFEPLKGVRQIHSHSRVSKIRTRYKILVIVTSCKYTLTFRIAYGTALGRGTRWRSWLRHYATSRKVAGSIPDFVIGIFHWLNPSDRTMALGSTQPLTEMSTWNIFWGVKAAGA